MSDAAVPSTEQRAGGLDRASRWPLARCSPTLPRAALARGGHRGRGERGRAAARQGARAGEQPPPPPLRQAERTAPSRTRLSSSATSCCRRARSSLATVRATRRLGRPRAACARSGRAPVALVQRAPSRLAALRRSAPAALTHGLRDRCCSGARVLHCTGPRASGSAERSRRAACADGKGGRKQSTKGARAQRPVHTALALSLRSLRGAQLRSSRRRLRGPAAAAPART